MKQSFWAVALLLVACAGPGAQPASAGGAMPSLETDTISPPHAFVCQAFVRSSVYETKLKPLEEIRMPKPGDQSISSGAFRFRVVYDNDRYETPTLITYVYSTSTGKLIEESLFQFEGSKNPVNQFMGGHGFTGLHYVYAPDSDAELQYICSSG